MSSNYFHVVNIYLYHDNLINNFCHQNNLVGSALEQFQQFGLKLDHHIENIKIGSNSDFELDIPSFDQYFSPPR